MTTETFTEMLQVNIKKLLVKTEYKIKEVNSVLEVTELNITEDHVTNY